MSAVMSFGSYTKNDGEKKRKGTAPGIAHETIELAESWGIDEELWDRNWSNLSGGEMQRIALAIAVGMRSAEILLLDGTYRRLLLMMHARSSCAQNLRRHSTQTPRLVWKTS